MILYDEENWSLITHFDTILFILSLIKQYEHNIMFLFLID